MGGRTFAAALACGGLALTAVRTGEIRLPSYGGVSARPRLGRGASNGHLEPDQSAGQPFAERQGTSGGRPYTKFHQHPAVGSGAGTYSVYGFQRRPYAQFVEDAHGLYLETAGELGAVGLALLIAVLALPLIAAIRGRHHPAVPAALGAYAAFLVHAGIDWDWELPVVTVVALISAATLLTAARGVGSFSLGRLAPWLLAAAFMAIGGLALSGLLSNTAISDAQSALSVGQWRTALNAAKTAEHYAPWSEQPNLIAGSAQQGFGNGHAAAAEFRTATAKSPQDWDAWRSLAETTTGRQHLKAIRMEHLLNPLSGTSAGSP